MPIREQRLQEQQYWFPYHYVPRRVGRSIRYAVAVDWTGEYLASLELVERALAGARPRHVLDVGCGDGRLVNELAASHPDVVFRGVDYSPRAVAFAEFYRTAPNARFEVADAEELGGDDDTYDLVTAVEVLEHVPPDRVCDFLRALHERLSADGTLLLTVPHRNKPLQPKHFQHFDRQTLGSAVNSALGDAVTGVEVRFIEELPRGLAWLRSKLARNRWFTIEPLFQRELERRSELKFVSERNAGRVVLTCRNNGL